MYSTYKHHGYTIHIYDITGHQLIETISKCPHSEGSSLSIIFRGFLNNGANSCVFVKAYIMLGLPLTCQKQVDHCTF